MTDSPKISDVLSDRDESKPFISIEFFPPRTEAGVTSLYKTIETYTKYDILFADFTWGAGGSTSDLTLKLCQDLKNRFNLNANMHLTCTNMPIEKVNHALETSKEAGITNILALRGDPPLGQTVWTCTEGGLSCALDLVKYIKGKYDDYFSITVAGYPEGHPTSMTVYDGALSDLTVSEQGRYSTEVNAEGATVINVCRDIAFKTEMDYLKAKVVAGASMIITQMFFDVEVFKTFVNTCRAEGINVPIIPGIMPVANYGGFKRMIGFCKTRVAKELLDQIEVLKDDVEGMKAFGIEFGVKMCRELLAFGVRGLHFYTLNTAGVTVAIMEQLGHLPIKESTNILPEVVTVESVAEVAQAVATVVIA
jgi:methylenetetrahydrofolate reductase (NADPH)